MRPRSGMQHGENDARSYARLRGHIPCKGRAARRRRDPTCGDPTREARMRFGESFRAPSVRLRGRIPQAGPCSALRRTCSALRRAGQNRPVPLGNTGLCQVRRLRRRDRWSVEQGPRCFLRGCDRETGQSTSPPVYARLRGQIPKGAPLPRCDVPCKGSSLSCLARLASIRTWRNARRVGYSELPWRRRAF